MSNWRKVWEEHNGPIPKGYHIHHIIPRSEGGTDDIENLQLVTPEEHYDIHFERGDYGACALISDGIDREPITIPVRQYSLTGEFINEFDSLNDAGSWIENNTNLKLKGFGGAFTIRKCCDYGQKSFGGYQWFYKSEVEDLEYVGEISREHNKGGNSTCAKKCKDKKTGKSYKSVTQMGKDIYKENYYQGIVNRQEFKDRLEYE